MFFKETSNIHHGGWAHHISLLVPLVSQELDLLCSSCTQTPVQYNTYLSPLPINTIDPKAAIRGNLDDAISSARALRSAFHEPNRNSLSAVIARTSMKCWEHVMKLQLVVSSARFKARPFSAIPTPLLLDVERFDGVTLERSDRVVPIVEILTDLMIGSPQNSGNAVRP